MAKTAFYIRETCIPETGNPSFTYVAVSTDGQEIEVTAGAFNSARRQGKPWMQRIRWDEENWSIDGHSIDPGCMNLDPKAGNLWDRLRASQSKPVGTEPAESKPPAPNLGPEPAVIKRAPRRRGQA